eukprot:Amastigsp_a677619_6.p2 type:complete len:359 gc:universal Amastigsp_a677619_6:1475-399(-)
MVVVVPAHTDRARSVDSIRVRRLPRVLCLGVPHDPDALSVRRAQDGRKPIDHDRLRRNVCVQLCGAVRGLCCRVLSRQLQNAANMHDRLDSRHAAHLSAYNVERVPDRPGRGDDGARDNRASSRAPHAGVLVHWNRPCGDCIRGDPSHSSGVHRRPVPVEQPAQNHGKFLLVLLLWHARLCSGVCCFACSAGVCVDVRVACRPYVGDCCGARAFSFRHPVLCYSPRAAVRSNRRVCVELGSALGETQRDRGASCADDAGARAVDDLLGARLPPDVDLRVHCGANGPRRRWPRAHPRGHDLIVRRLVCPCAHCSPRVLGASCCDAMARRCAAVRLRQDRLWLCAHGACDGVRGGARAGR